MKPNPPSLVAALAAAVLLAAAPASAAGPAASSKPDKRLVHLEQRAAKGDPDAQMTLAVNRLAGGSDVVPKDPEKGLDMLQKLASRDYAIAQEYLGMYYDTMGEAPVKDPAKALTWYEKAAEQGNYAAQTRAGTLVFPIDGNSLADPEKAYFWLTLGLLGKYSENVRGLREQVRGRIPAERLAALDEKLRSWEPRQGLAWKNQVHIADYPSLPALQRGAEAGDPFAQLELGLHYGDGFVLAHDDEKAVGWFKRAAEQGYTAAQDCLASAYSQGRGVPQDMKEAFFWLSVERDGLKKRGKHDRDAEDAYAAAAEKVGAAEAVEIDRRAREWKPKPEGKAPSKKAAKR